MATPRSESWYRHWPALGHSTRDLDMVVHGDDFIVSGDGDDLDLVVAETG